MEILADMLCLMGNYWFGTYDFGSQTKKFENH